MVLSVGGVAIRLTEERWAHITRRHPEMSTMRTSVLQTVSEPDLVQVGDVGSLLAIRLYPTTPLTRKHLVVPYREVTRVDGFVLTAYLTSSPSTTRVVSWTRSESWRAPQL